MSELPRVLQGVTAAMRHLSDRQRVIAENVANSETPGYKARTIETPDFGALLNEGRSATVRRPTVALTRGMASLGATSPASQRATVLDRSVTETKPDGNNVTLEDQLMQLGQVQADYATMTNMYRKQMQLLKTALGRGGQ